MEKAMANFHWFLSSNTQPRGVFIVLHGLNNNPVVMDPLINELTGRGYHALRITFTGHTGDPGLKHTATAEKWCEDLRAGYKNARERFPDLPFYNLSYSLGAAVTMTVLGSDSTLRFEKLILIAPALKLRPYTILAKLLSNLRFLKLSLPSGMEPQHRAHTTTSLYSYHGMFRLIDGLKKKSGKLRCPPALVLLSPEDEFISLPGLKSWIKSHCITNWRIVTLNLKPEKKGVYYHFPLNPEATGRIEWGRMVEEIMKFLKP